MLAKFVPLGRQSQLLYAFKNKLNQEESELVQRAIYQAMLVPSHEVSLVRIDSPIGQLWQSHAVIKATGKRIERNYPTLSETIERGETPLEAAVRGIQDELGLAVPPDRLILAEANRLEIRHSRSENKLKRYLFQVYQLEISQEEAEAAQLEADEEDAIVYFEWRQTQT